MADGATTPGFVSNHVQHGVLQTVWAGISGTATGLAENLSRYPTHSVTFSGTFGGATVVLQGSDDGVTFVTLLGEATTGDALISATSATRFDFPNVVPQFIRPVTSGGTGTSITVTIISKTYGN